MQLTPDEILNLARTAVPDYLRSSGRIVKGGPALATATRLAKGRDPQEEAAQALAKSLGVTIEADSDTVEVEFPEPTPAGLRSTVVHIRDGQVHRVIKRA